MAGKAYVYLLHSLNTGKFYVGWTTDIKRRLEEHNMGKSQYTKSRGPWELISYETFLNPESAKERERKLKHNPKMLSYFKKRALATLRVSAALQQNRKVVG
jgi:putative endonuclease